MAEVSLVNSQLDFAVNTLASRDPSLPIFLPEPHKLAFAAELSWRLGTIQKELSRCDPRKQF